MSNLVSRHIVLFSFISVVARTHPVVSLQGVTYSMPDRVRMITGDDPARIMGHPLYQISVDRPP